LRAIGSSIAAPANPGRLTHQLYRRALTQVFIARRLKQIFGYRAEMAARPLATRPQAQDGIETPIALYA